MTVRDLVNAFLDLQLWQALILLVWCAFVGGIARAAGRDFAETVTKSVRTDSEPKA